MSAVAEAALPRDLVKPNVKMLGLLAVGHLTVDSIQGAFPALLPALRDAHGLSYQGAGAIILVSTLTSSVIQPAFGYLSDRSARRWLLPWAVLCAGLGMAFLGFAPSYWAVLALTVLSGVGIAAYHPEGYKTAASVAGTYKATGVSWFSVGGNVGIAVGPILIGALVARFGSSGSLGMLAHPLLVALVLFAVQPYLARQAAAKKASAESLGPTLVGAMILLVVVVMFRSWTQLGFTTYIAFYYRDVLGADARLAEKLLSVFLGAGAVGTLVGGVLADRFGPRRFTLSAFALATPLAVLFLVATRTLPLWTQFLLLAALGFVLVATFTTSVVLAQAYLPRHHGMASGLIVGLAIGAGGIGAWVLGMVADSFGLPSALWAAAVSPILGFGAALFLPETKRS